MKTHSSCLKQMPSDNPAKKQSYTDFFKEIVSNKRYFDLIQAIIVVLDRNGKVLFINEFGQNLLGKIDNEILGKNWFETFLPEDIRKKVYSVFISLMKGESSNVEYYENPVLISDGSQRIIAWRNSLLRDNEGNPIATLSTGIDVTSQRNAEKQLIASKEKVEQYFDLMAHDIANMISPVMAYSEMLKFPTFDIPKSKKMQLIEKIYEQSRYISRLVLNLRRLEMQEREAVRERVEIDIRELVKEMIETLRKKHPDKTVRFSCIIPKNSRIKLRRKECIEITLENLLDNAIKFSNRQRVFIRFTAHKIMDGSKRYLWKLTIEDNGPGLPPDITALINKGVSMESYTRWHLISTLGFCAMLISLCGGNMCAESPIKNEPSGGTRFIIEIPAMT